MGRNSLYVVKLQAINLCKKVNIHFLRRMRSNGIFYDSGEETRTTYRKHGVIRDLNAIRKRIKTARLYEVNWGAVILDKERPKHDLQVAFFNNPQTARYTQKRQQNCREDKTHHADWTRTTASAGLWNGKGYGVVGVRRTGPNVNW
jgi:hypothetical protein